MAGYTRTLADAGAVTLIQRFGSALILSINFHMLLPDRGVIKRGARFRWVSEPPSEELARLTRTFEVTSDIV